LYHSTDLDGNDILVSGVVAAPDAPAPDGGRTVVSWGHPTTGTTERCAPSVGIDPFDTIEGLEELITRGYVVVATDYAGMGAPGPDSFLVGETEGRNVLDAARVASELEVGASDRVARWGHSQGGHAALFAAESADSYAPELDVQAVAVAAPAVDLAGLLDADIGDISGVTIAAYAFDAYASVYEKTRGAELDEILTPEAVAVVPEMAALCLFGQNDELHELGRPLVGGFLAADLTTVEPWADLLAENTPGTQRLDVPLYVAQGATDTLVHPELTAAFVAQQQALGTNVTSQVLPDTGHALVAVRALATMLPWLEGVAPAQH
ncbi:MAG TPA: lipase family protein, partial [Agromyces sp.]